ncbi:MAG TPA: Wzz/FepE/Etk N-terminal domain-containing protein [Myxococcota bacterium]|nr:Wzz/FepE/Etk N-terminal domain-containing protein [Myxococcota bacterium]
MSDDLVPAPAPDGASGEGKREPEVRLELTNAGVRQVWALYSQERDSAAPPPPPPPVEEDPLSVFLRDLPGIAWRGRGWVLGSLALVLALGIFYLAYATPVYNVGAQLLVERRASPLDMADRLRGGSNFLATQTEIIHSPTILGVALAAVPELTTPPPDLEPGAFFDPVSKELRALSATPIVGTDVLSISYRTSSPALGVRLLENLITTYRDYIVALEQSPHSEALALLVRREQELRAQLVGLETQYQALRRQSESFGEGGGALGVQRSVLERQAQMLIEAKGRRIEAENRLAALRNSYSPGGGHTGVSGSDSALEQELWRAESHLAQLMQNYSEIHPEVQTVRQQIATLKRQLAESSTAALEREFEAATGTEQRMVALYERELEKGKSLDVHRVKEDQLLAEVRSLAAVHDAALAKLKEVELETEARAEGGAGVVVRVLEGPAADEEAMWPRPELVLLPCALVGLMGGLGLAVVLDRVNGRRLPRLVTEPSPRGRTTVADLEPIS